MTGRAGDQCRLLDWCATHHVALEEITLVDEHCAGLSAKGLPTKSVQKVVSQLMDSPSLLKASDIFNIFDEDFSRYA